MSLPFNLRIAARLLRGHGAATATIVLMLGVGIGLLSAVFVPLHRLVVRPIAVAEPEELVVLRGQFSSESARQVGFATRSFVGMASFQAVGLTVADGEGARTVQALLVSDNYFSLLGVRAAIGDAMLDGGAEGAEPGLVVTDAFWRRRLGGNPDVVGDRLQVNGISMPVAGVLPGDFAGTRLDMRPQIFLSLGLTPRLDVFSTEALSSYRWLNVLGRLREGVSIATGESEINGLFVSDGASAAAPRIRLVPADDASLNQDAWNAAMRSSALLAAAAAVVFLIGCLNAGGLFLVRVEGRRRELALRQALGATTWGLGRQIALECALAAAVAAGVGMLVCSWTAWALNLSELSSLFPIPLPDNPTTATVSAALFFAAASAVGSAILPLVWIARRTRSLAVLHMGVRSGVVGAFRVHGAIVAAQVALSVSLVIFSFLLARTAYNEQQIETGYDVDRVLVMRTPQRLIRTDRDAGRAWLALTLARLRSSPFVDQASMVLLQPLGGVTLLRSVSTTGVALEVGYNAVDRDYFRTMGIRLLQGQTFTDDAADQVVVNETFARTLWPEGGALDLQLQLVDAGLDRAVRVVGVAEDAKYESLFDEQTPHIYMAIADLTNFGRPEVAAAVVIRTATESSSEARSGVMRIARASNPEGAIPIVQPLTALIESNLQQPIRLAFLVGAVSTVSVLFAMAGMYGLLSYWAAQRRRELALRIAMGASPTEILTLVGVKGLAVGGLGVLGGLTLAVAASPFWSPFLFGVGGVDSMTYGAAAVLGLAVAGVASYEPARRMVHTEVMTLLKAE